MRKINEPTARNLLRQPMILGVPLFPLLALSFCVMLLFVFSSGSTSGSVAILGMAIAGYCGLRVIAHVCKSGWEESCLFWLESRIPGQKQKNPELRTFTSTLECHAPDTLDLTAQLRAKEELRDRIEALKPTETLRLLLFIDQNGAKVMDYTFSSAWRGKDWKPLWPGIFDVKYAYSLYQLPAVTSPLWLSSLVSHFKSSVKVLASIRGLDPFEVKRRVEISRRRNARDETKISDIDCEVSFSEASQVLEALSIGEEKIVEFSMVISANVPLSLDPGLFCEEKNRALCFQAITGLRSRFHRSHYVRSVTASDLIPNLIDPFESGRAILKSRRGNALYFDPTDSRLEALHWLVVGASGSGKSFFTGLVLKRLIEEGATISVLFVDHNRSFRRFVRSRGAVYAEPQSISTLEDEFSEVVSSLNQVGSMVGIELSDLTFDEKKTAAQLLLVKIESFLRQRETSHPVYVVLDECWNFLRDEPVLVQRAFREFRKLNGAVVAVTQSLSDFLSDISGRSILQNAPVRILLRQGEDPSPYRGALDLNDVELSELRLLRQRKGEYSECLIKTPYLSKIGRLYPTPEEHELLRTDNLREELIRNSTLKREEALCV